MPLISQINLFLGSGLVALLLGGLVLILKHQPKSVYRSYLVWTLLFWALVFTGTIIKFHSDDKTLVMNEGVANMRILFLGIPCFFTLLSLPVMILNSMFIKISTWLKFTFPVLLSVAVYLFWHKASGLDPFAPISKDYFFQNIASPIVWSRIVVILIFIAYIIFSQQIILRITPLYDKYINDNISDSSYNIDWIHRLTKHIYLVSFLYFVMLFAGSLIANTIYLVATIALFSYLIERSLFYKALDNITPIKITWKYREGWQFINEESHEIKPEESQIFELKLDKKIDKWMVKTEKFTNVDFGLDDILNDFPNLTNGDLSLMFKSRGETFQSYVRRYRINKACEIMDKQSNNIYPKQLFSMVGFSHYSSFSRSFVAVMNQSPSGYLSNAQKRG